MLKVELPYCRLLLPCSNPSQFRGKSAFSPATRVAFAAICSNPSKKMRFGDARDDDVKRVNIQFGTSPIAVMNSANLAVEIGQRDATGSDGFPSAFPTSQELEVTCRPDSAAALFSSTAVRPAAARCAHHDDRLAFRGLIEIRQRVTSRDVGEQFQCCFNWIQRRQ